MSDIISNERISKFLSGRDEQERIVNVECGYADKQVTVFYRDENGVRKTKRENFYPFVWATQFGGGMLYESNRQELLNAMSRYGIGCKGLTITNSHKETTERMEKGYRVLFYSKVPMTYSTFLRFFKQGGVDFYNNEKQKKQFLAVTPLEQFLIHTGKRFFKGYEDYDELIRLEFDLETDGLEPEKHRINQIGVRNNKGVDHIIEVSGTTETEFIQSEIQAIKMFFKCIQKIDPDVITGHNSENFDWNFIIVRCQVLGIDIKEISELYFGKGNYIYKKKRATVLKLGGEVEHFHQTVLNGRTMTDSLHAVRRAQAIDSNMKKADLKYVTKYSKLEKKNRVYVPGQHIKTIWKNVNVDYAFNDVNGDWYEISEKKPLKEGYEIVNGPYIMRRYLKDDLYETDKVELTYNQSNFLLTKILPTTFGRACTMGTASTWKLLMLAWSYENNLAVPMFSKRDNFTGGLSRLVLVGYVADIVKLDFNSLYPAITLTWKISPDLDISGVMLQLLSYILDQRELYKGLMGNAKKLVTKLKNELEKYEIDQKNGVKIENLLSKLENLKDEIQAAEAEANKNDKKQLPFKIFGNSFFGAFGAPYLYPWGDLTCAENITCIGRQSLRLMNRWFYDRGFQPVVMDSVTGDTPIFIKYKSTGIIDIIPIEDIFNDGESIEWEHTKQLRDFSKKEYDVLTRNGWVDVKYVYKHKTNKKIHRIKTKDVLIDVTEDHSLFDINKNEIQPKNIRIGDKIELFENNIDYTINNFNLCDDTAWLLGLFIGDGSSKYGNRKTKYFSKKKKEFVLHNNKRSDWKISNLDYNILIKAQKILKEQYNISANILDNRKSSGVYNLRTSKTCLTELYSKICYTKNRLKKVPFEILNSDLKIKKSFLDGLMAADGYGIDLENSREIGQKSKTVMASIGFLLKEVGVNYRIRIRKDKPNFITFYFKNQRNNIIDDDKSLQKSNEVFRNDVLFEEYNDYVYDISADGTFVNALGMNVLHNTDGCNFQIPTNAKDYVYIGKGLNRNTVEGKEYKGVEAYVAEFNDLFMREKMGLGIDEYAPATINFSRKNYADLLKNGKVKLVGNSIKSKMMPTFIEKFLDNNMELLLHNNGKQFLINYYEYIEKIYNGNIPLKDIASKGRIKKSKEEYLKDIVKLNKAGNQKGRQAWYELVIQDNIKVDMGDVIYYVNIGTKKNEGDVKKVPIYEKDEEGKEVRTEKRDKKTGEILYTKKGKPRMERVIKEHKTEVNCIRIDNTIIENEDDIFGNEEDLFPEPIMYNTAKYISTFNKKIEPLLVCFSPEIREQILISNPEDKKYFTDEQSVLVSGFPRKPLDQDSFEELMTLSDREIKFWLDKGEEPVFLNEIGLNWEEMVEQYHIHQEELKRDEIKLEKDMFDNILDEITKNDIDYYYEHHVFNDNIMKKLSDFLTLNEKRNFISNKFNIKIGTLDDILDKNIFEFIDD